MIKRLRLSRWRGFDSINLELDRGTTFVVAANGSGKTSVLLGMVWAIFGDEAAVNARECIRAGATNAAAEVTLILNNRSELTVRRQISERGKQTAHHDLDGAPLSDEQLKRVLHETYGVEPRVAAQLSFMMGGGHVASQTGLDLKTHLYEAFGIAGLHAATEAATVLTRSATKKREAIRLTARQDITNRVAADQRLEQINEILAEARQTREQLTRTLAETNALRDLMAEWNRYDDELTRRSVTLNNVLSIARQLGFSEDTDLATALERALVQHRAQLSDTTEQITEARARHRAAQNALLLLETDDPSCPTCLRPFHGAELDEAVRIQQAELEAAAAAETTWRQAAVSIENEIARLDKLRQGLSQVPPIPTAPARPRPDRDPDQAMQEALAALQTHDAAVGQTEHELAVLRRQLSDNDELRRLERTQQAAYRREAISRAVTTALTETTEELTRCYIEPLSEQIRWRWKALFGEEGLQLKPDGTIVRVIGDRELSWDSLSGGERIWARLVTHLLVLGTSTRLPFAWFDEPLEHLDPRARRAVASALATATRTAGPEQLIVTTYEHAIARQLAADIPEASIKYIRRSPHGNP